MRRFTGPALRLLAVWAFVLVFPVSSLAAPGADAAAQREYLEGLRAYAEGRYQAAAGRFGALAMEGRANPRLYANLARALTLSGETGPAMLWRLRALRLAPDDPDARYDLETTGKGLGYDAAGQGAAWTRAVFFLYGPLSPGALTVLALVLEACLFAALAVARFGRLGRLGRFGRRFDPRGRLKRLAGRLALASGAAFVIVAASAAYALYAVGETGQAVVLPRELPVRSGKGPDASVLFTLRAGQAVTAVRREDGFVLVENGPGKLGFAPEAALGFVAGPPRPGDLPEFEPTKE